MIFYVCYADFHLIHKRESRAEKSYFLLQYKDRRTKHIFYARFAISNLSVYIQQNNNAKFDTRARVISQVLKYALQVRINELLKFVWIHFFLSTTKYYCK